MRNRIENILAFTRQLVEIPSQNGIDSEAAIAQAVLDRLQADGFSPQIIGSDDHPSVICRIEKPRATRHLWLESCLDTVPAGTEDNWNHPPLAATVVGERLYGRGVADAKLAIALFCELAGDLHADPDVPVSLFLGFDADEQSGRFTGIRDVMQQSPIADACILGYQGIDEISIGARGWLRLKLTVRGQAAHTGDPAGQGVNAVHAMAQVITGITALEIGQARTDFFDFGSALNVAQICGGVAINMVPDHCEALLDIRLIPDQDPDQVIAQIHQAGKVTGADYTIEILQQEQAYLTDPQNSFVQLLHDTACRILPEPIPLVASGQGSVGNVVSASGIPIINAFGAACGNAHAPNEWIDTTTVEPVYQIYRQSIANFAAH